MTTVKDVEPDHVLALLGFLLEDLRRDVTAATRSSSRRMPPQARGMRSSQLRLLSLTPREGLRATDLAQRLGMSKQSLGELADALEARGLLESVRDASDRRVRILRPTRRGTRVVETSTAVIEEVEAAWRERLGARRWDQLRRLLREAHASADAESAAAP